LARKRNGKVEATTVLRIVLLLVAGLVALVYFRMHSTETTDSAPPPQVQTWGDKMAQAYKICTGIYGDEKARNHAQIECDRGCAGKSGDDEQSGDEEVGDLNPASRAVAHQAQRMARPVKALAREDLGEADDDVERPGSRAQGQKRVAGGACSGRTCANHVASCLHDE